MKRLCIVVLVVVCGIWTWSPQAPSFQTGPFPDFDDDGVVGFADFLQFAGKFGAARGDETYDERIDLDGDGLIGFPDFLIFAGNFGRASPFAGDENDVHIPDANLRAVIADSLGKPRDASISRAEMATLSELRAHDAGIKDLTGLQFAINLESLWFTYNPFSDLTALCDLNKLEVLVFNGNSIADLSALSGLTNLTDLFLNDNRVPDLSPLSGLPSLTIIGVNGNEIKDMSALSGLTGLTRVALSRNAISDISSLSTLTNLIELDLSVNAISDISTLSGLTNLTHLNLSHNRIPGCDTDLDVLSSLTDLIQLNLRLNRISDLSALMNSAGLGGLDLVDVRDNPLSVESLNVQVPALQGRGVDVQFDDWLPVSECLPILPPENSVDAGSSHTLQTNHLYVDHRQMRPGYRRGGVPAIAYADFNGDGHIDVFYAPSDGSQRDPVPAELYLNDGAGCFTLDTSFLGASPPGRLAPRKALPGDFNGDGRMDVFVLDHGYDKPPFPGAAPYVILSSKDGYVLGTGLEKLVGFHHGGASGDIDADGDIDVFVTSSPLGAPFFLINDGSGSFSVDSSRIQGIRRHDQLYTAELVDVDGDGYLELLAAGHEHDLAGGLFPTQILWGSSTGLYSTDAATILPEIFGRGIVIDIDVSDTDGDGDKDIVINRTGDDRTYAYGGYYVQLVEQIGVRRFEDRTTRLIHQNQDEEADAILWIRMCDCDEDGDVDIVVDDAARKLIWKNDGTGTFHVR